MPKSRRSAQNRRLVLLRVLLVVTLLICLSGIGQRLLRERAAQASLEALQMRVQAEDDVALICIEALDAASEPGASTIRTQTAPAPRLPACAALAHENPDLAGWLTVPGTQADCPVMYTPQRPRYYYRRDFNGDESRSGLPFIDEASAPDARNVLIYGHNMKSGAIFGELKRFLKEDFAFANREFVFDTLAQAGQYRVIAVFRTVADANADFRFYDYAAPESEEALLAYHEAVLSRSEIDFGETVEASDRLVTLVTCSNHAENGRLVLVGKRIG